MTTIANAKTWAVGDVLTPLVAGRVSRTQLALFAGGSGDHNPIHIDIDVAKAAGFDDVFAQGMLGMAILGRIVTDNFPLGQIKSFSTRFSSITPVNAKPTCTGEIVAIEGDVLTVSLKVALADGTVTLEGQAIVDLSA